MQKKQAAATVAHAGPKGSSITLGEPKIRAFQLLKGFFFSTSASKMNESED